MHPSPEDVAAAHRARQEDPDPLGPWAAFLFVVVVGLLLAAMLGAGGELRAVAPYVVGTSSGWFVRFRPAFRFHDLNTPGRFSRLADDLAPGAKVATGRLNPGGRHFVYRAFLPHEATEGSRERAQELAEEIRRKIERAP